jgi:subtilisin family serine protease
MCTPSFAGSPVGAEDATGETGRETAVLDSFDKAENGGAKEVADGKQADFNPPSFVGGELLVAFRAGTSRPVVEGLLSRLGELEILDVIMSLGEVDLYRVKLPAWLDVAGAAGALSSMEEILYAEPNFLVRQFEATDEPFFGNQWGLHNTGQSINGRQGRADADVDAVEAWEIEKGDSNPVVVAVIDSGTDMNHPDLRNRHWVNTDERAGNNVDDDGNGYIDDRNGFAFSGISHYYVDAVWTFGNLSMLDDAVAQSFVARAGEGGRQRVTHVGIMIRKVGNPRGSITVSVTGNDPNRPLGSFTITSDEVGSDPVEIYKRLDREVYLESGRTYYLLVYTNNRDPDNYYQLLQHWKSTYEYPGDQYVDGMLYWYNWTGARWMSEPENDLYFRTNPYDYPHDLNGHGTHCAGIIGADVNGRGIAGVAHGSNVKIMTLKVMDSSGSAMVYDTVEAIRYAADNGAKVISMSLGSPQYSRARQEAVDYAFRKGALVVAAVGNTGDSTVNYPAGCRNVLGVGATTNRDEAAAFSTHNETVDVSAPGLDIYSTTPTYPVTKTADPRSGVSEDYSYMSGTSMACPLVAGAAAVLLSNQPSLGPSEVQEVIQATAEDLGEAGRDDRFGYGRINLAEALRSVQRSEPRLDPDPDPDPGDTERWYLAEGTTAWGFDTYVSIMNAGESAAVVDITYMTDTGPVSGGRLELPALSQTTVYPRHVLGERDFSTLVECVSGGPIAVDRTMTWTGPGAASPEAHYSIGVTSPAKTWYLPEGSSNWGFETWLLIQNPNAETATCRVTYMIEGEGPVTKVKEVPPHSRRTYNMADDIGRKDASIRVQSDIPVIPERAMYRNNRREGHASIGSTSPAADYYLAEGTTGWGFTTYVLIQNPNDEEVEVDLTYMTSEGPVPHPQGTILMPPNSRKTVRVNDFLPDRDFSTRVHGSKPIIAERAMYWDNGTGEACHDSIGMKEPAACFYLPDGETSNGRETWVLVQNPNDTDIVVEVFYLRPGGEPPVVFADTIPANSRRTYNMAAGGVDGRAAVMVKSGTPGKPIMCERAMYWNNRGAGTDTIGGCSR